MDGLREERGMASLSLSFSLSPFRSGLREGKLEMRDGMLVSEEICE